MGRGAGAEGGHPTSHEARSRFTTTEPHHGLIPSTVMNGADTEHDETRTILELLDLLLR
jgi:hypothetical protein